MGSLHTSTHTITHTHLWFTSSQSCLLSCYCPELSHSQYEQPIYRSVDDKCGPETRHLPAVNLSTPPPSPPARSDAEMVRTLQQELFSTPLSPVDPKPTSPWTKRTRPYGTESTRVLHGWAKPSARPCLKLATARRLKSQSVPKTSRKRRLHPRNTNQSKLAPAVISQRNLPLASSSQPPSPSSGSPALTHL